MALSRERLDALYEVWNRPEFIHPDPLEFLSAYPDVAQREVVGLVAASLAYGRVTSILQVVERVLQVLGENPVDYVCHRSEVQMEQDLEGIVHRFARPSHLAALLAGVGKTLVQKGSLEAAFLQGYGSSDFAGGLISLTSSLRLGVTGDCGHLLPKPEKGSACKRLCLYLRWMVRQDAVDLGGWERVSPAHLWLPLDTWMHRIALLAGWTHRKSADVRTVQDVTQALAKICPEDPIRYDFALSRYGIRQGLSPEEIFQ